MALRGHQANHRVGGEHRSRKSRYRTRGQRDGVLARLPDGCARSAPIHIPNRCPGGGPRAVRAYISNQALLRSQMEWSRAPPAMAPLSARASFTSKVPQEGYPSNSGKHKPLRLDGAVATCSRTRCAGSARRLKWAPLFFSFANRKVTSLSPLPSPRTPFACHGEAPLPKR
jgi:hypothetical protein